ncbi:MAG: L-serine ammonia-lyase, iron-sulfur-dependent, subunit alpha [Bacteroidia bacterium]|nr:L-serine ammonia-lyase, iron-sulfur-dependent, subunit alpha [Bacteroidia bacterium]MDW8159518.1 L-serine ammonia-lyase, iron-sulfur-dependent, subunit alpha [Bacteroidia bacterium]
MSILFDSFQEWGNFCQTQSTPLWQPVLEYEIEQKGRTEAEIWNGIEQAYSVMCQAIETGLTKDMRSFSGMINNGAKRVRDCKINVLNEDFRKLIYRTLAAKEVNSCMGKIVAAPTAGASGILPGILFHLQDIHQLPNQKIYEAMLVAAGVALIIERRASIAGAVGGCQAETGTAAAMGAAAIVYCLGGSWQQSFNAVAITIMNMLGLICDPIAGLVEVPCVKRNASAAAIAYTAAQMAIADYDPIIPVDEVVDVMGEVGESMERKYKETALGGLAATPTGKAIAQRVLQTSAEILPPDEPEN